MKMRTVQRKEEAEERLRMNNTMPWPMIKSKNGSIFY